MADQLYAGSLNDFDTVESMAGEMEKALAKANLIPPNGDPRMRHIVLIALSQGIINHLQFQQGAFSVTVRDDPAAPNVTHLARISVK